MSTTYESVALARAADILFCSALTPKQHRTDARVFTAIRESLAQHGDWKACMRVVARAFVTDADAAAERLMWCRATVADAWEAHAATAITRRDGKV